MTKMSNTSKCTGVRTALVGCSLVLCMLACVGQGCPSSCQRCNDGVIQCQNIGLREIPNNLPEDSLTVDFSRNQVTSVTRQSFQVLPNVLSLRLISNKIRNINAQAFSRLSNLMTLDLTSNELTTINNRAFQGLTHLSTLSLSQNQIQTLDRVLAKTPALTSLNARSNQLTNLEENTFERNTELRQLDLSNNQITSIHGRAFKNLRKLRYLIINNNPLVNLPQLIFAGAMLQLVDFSNCQLTRVPRTMPPSVTDFRLGTNHIEHVTDTDLQNITNLKLLTLNNNRISSFAYRALRGLDNLEELWLSTNQLVYIPRGLPTNLKKLNQEFNQVTELESRLFSEDSMLRSLILENNNIATIHADALHGLQWLEEVNLQGNMISEIQTNTFKDLPHLKKIYLSSNPISIIHPGSFQSLQNLTTLHMSYMDTRPSTIASDFLSGIQNAKRLEFLNSPAFVHSLMELVSQENRRAFPNLEHIDLQFNDLATLPRNLKRLVANAREVLLDGNTWHCDRQLIFFKRWETSSDQVFFRNEAPVCESPRHLSGRLITSISNNQFVSVTSPSASQPHSSSGVFHSAIAMQDVPELRSLDVSTRQKSADSPQNTESKITKQSNLDEQSKMNTNKGDNPFTKQGVKQSKFIITPTETSSSEIITTNSLESLKKPKSQKRRKHKNRKKKERRHRKRSTGKKKRRCRKSKSGKKCSSRKSKSDRKKPKGNLTT